MTLLREYETVYVLKPDLTDDDTAVLTKRVKDTVEAQGGKILRWHSWGKRTLAYPIAKHTKGTYFYLHFLGSSGIVREFERTLRLVDPVIRFLTTKIDADVDPEARPVENTEPVLIKVDDGGGGRRRERRRDRDFDRDGDRGGDRGGDDDRGDDGHDVGVPGHDEGREDETAGRD